MMISFFKYIAQFSVISLFLTSCLPEPLEITVPQAESKLVVSSQVIPGNFIAITVSRSFSALEGSYGQGLDSNDIEKFLVKDAIVVLSYANRVDTLISNDNTPGVYFSLLRLEEENENFDLYVYDPKTETSVTANSKMLNRVEVETAAIKARATGTIIDTIYDLNYTFNDPAGDNWYVVNIFNPNNLQDQFSFGEDNSVYTQLISDKLYNTSTIEINTEIIDFNFTDTMVFMFSNISEDYFRFLDARQRGGNIISSITGEPINHPTNIQGGYGFFNSHNPSLRQIVIKK
ncbi:MAG: DUF4249 family protein [Bacteroidia bacterium]